uniref:Poly A polymerase head domain-containing protein n=1 Tax=Glossina austeni TaxID=7395 RepID=A0A1A9V8B5_GLOAU
MSRNVTVETTVMKLDNAQFERLLTKEVIQLREIFRKYKHELRIVGGAVRDLLRDVEPRDIDFATTANVYEMKNIFYKESIYMINLKGEKHGTVTVHINNKNFEITTLRIKERLEDATDPSMWQTDASKRDLTVNAMFLDFNGSLYDYFNGYNDLLEKRVVFVDDAFSRITEDYLRILRYFRFYGSLAEEPFKYDESTLKIIKAYAAGLSVISGERIWSELKKILSSPYAKELMLEMIECDIPQYCGLIEKANVEEFKRACSAVKGKSNLNPISLAVAMLNNVMEAIKMHERLKLTSFERDLSFFIIQERDKVDKTYIGLNDYQEIYLKRHVKREFIEELLKYSNKEELFLAFKDWNGNLNVPEE